MDLLKWKRFKRSGAFRRNIRRKYLKLMQKPAASLRVSEASASNNIFEGSVQNNSDLFGDTEEIVNSDYSDRSSENESVVMDNEKNLQLQENIKKWVIKYNISHSAYNELAVIVNNRIEHILPKDARTLLHTTDKKIHIIALGTGNYWHNGLIDQMRKILENVDVLNVISLNINIDGVPLYNSSRKQFWPILCTIFEMPSLPPLVIGIYAGDSKPSNLEAYLDPLVQELNQLSCGLTLVDKSTGLETIVSVKIRAFICDSPARALIKGVVNFNGKHGCLKCTVVGEYSQVSRTVTFLKYDCPKRTDEDFRSKKDEEHHKQDSPLLKLKNIDMIENFPVSDSLHLIDLGIMKRLLIGWRDGNIGKYLTKWCSRDIGKVNNFLSNCRLPKEIHRSVRKLDVLAHWKGSEYRTFLHYLSFVILKDALQSEAYYHFLLLFCAITICSNEKHFKFLSIAEKMLEKFVEIFKKIYGKDYVSSNVHNLTHLVDEVRRFGILQSYNAYPFENQLYVIKNLIRQGNKPLEQVARRLNERFHLEMENIEQKNQSSYPFVKKSENKSKSEQIYFSSFMLSQQDQNKWFLSKEDHVIELQSIIVKNDKDAKHILIHGYRIENICDAFDEPLKSSFLNIFKCYDYDDGNKIKVVCEVSNVKCKLVKVEHNSELFFIPLLHTL